LEEYPRDGIFVEDDCPILQRYFPVSDGEIPCGQELLNWPWIMLLMNLFPFDLFRLFSACQDWAFAFYTSCVPLLGNLLIANRRMGGWTSFFFYIPKIQAYFTFDGTLVFNDCMEWVNIPRWGVYLGWHGQKICFPLLVNCANSGYQKGFGWQRSSKISILELRFKLTFLSCFLPK
jgi:hypothetical protein